ncbi:hypothetical protein ANN_02856 [Periplaneta americana]|uniref:Uncharacterized protein n=1 Tax=Periplaneta americana TaxID=6978 RepID=A0ABQ8TXF8_PERAM|nr:hypothetical protein ANN_02856 [Periplaneta americana]
MRLSLKEAAKQYKVVCCDENPSSLIPEGLFGKITHRRTRGDEGHGILPFYGPISSKIGRLLRKDGIKTIHKPPTKIQNLLRPVKDDLGLRTPGVYKIPCECGKCYIGQTGRTIIESCKEHQRSIRLYYPDKSAVAQHSLKTGHKIDFGATTILDKISGVVSTEHPGASVSYPRKTQCTLVHSKLLAGILFISSCCTTVHTGQHRLPFAHFSEC